MVSLKARNPFKEGTIELLSVKTWVGLGAFCVILGAVGLGVKWVMGKGTKAAGSVADQLWDKV